MNVDFFFFFSIVIVVDMLKSNVINMCFVDGKWKSNVHDNLTEFDLTIHE